MSPNVTGFRWDSRRERAAVLVAEDDLTDVAIAAQLGIDKRTLERWKQLPAFRERVAAHAAALEAEALTFAIAKRRKRVAMLDRQAERLRAVFDARAADPLMADIPGGDTGLLVAEPMLMKVYESNAIEGDDDADGILLPTKRSIIVHKYAVDTGTLKELRATLEQAAKELGQWTEKRDLTSGGEAMRFTIDIDSRNRDGEG